MDELKFLTEYYNNYDEEGRLTSKHGQVEFLTTMRYINKFLKKGMGVLEVGAGTGRYSLTIAPKGRGCVCFVLYERGNNCKLGFPKR